jgi:predicted transcriptional regulator
LRREQALARYKAVMGDEWVKTFEIGRRLNAASGSLQKILRGWHHAGLVERRKADKGFEWRLP